MYTYTKFTSLPKTWATWKVFSNFCNMPEDKSSTYCRFLNVWIQQSQSETNGLMSASPEFDPSDRWPSLPLSIANLASGRELKREDTRVSAFALRLLSVWIHARPVQVTFSAWRQAFLTRPWSLYGPLWHLALFWVLPAIKKSQLQQLFCHRSLSRMVFPPKRGQEKVDYWSRAGPMGPRSHFPGHLSS